MDLLLLVALMQALALRIINADQNSYIAAVLEYPPITDNPTAEQNWQENLKEILHFIQDASNQRAQIIVLPEDALSGWDISEKDVEVLSTEVPNPSEGVLPCTVYHNNNFSSTLRDLSCAAQNHKIYVVANLIEKVSHPSAKPTYHNTNVVFNRNGELITRYRKMNLFNEPFFVPGNELVTFTTDFGVTFGMFICFDMVFKTPSQELLKRYNVTDVVYSAAWFSYLPFYQSLTTQHGYAKATGVNLLAAGLNQPNQTNGGSGIYLADGSITETFISGLPLPKLIVQEVPKISSRKPNTSCNFQKSSGSYEWGTDPFTGNISNFKTIKEDMSNYTFKSLNLLDQSTVVETVCSSSSSFCCTFNITVSRSQNVQPNYVYKLAAFQGAWMASTTGTIGIRNCGIVACLNDSTDTCGERKALAPRGITFEKIGMKAVIDARETRYHPATLTFDLKPITDYTYCANEVGDGKTIIIKMNTTDPHDNLLTFGLAGRVFRYDNQPAGIINSASCTNFSLGLILCLINIVIFVFNG